MAIPEEEAPADVAGIIEGFLPGWLGGTRAADATVASAARAPRSCTAAEVACTTWRDDVGIAAPVTKSRVWDADEADTIPPRPVVEVEGIVPAWIGQARTTLVPARSFLPHQCAARGAEGDGLILHRMSAGRQLPHRTSGRGAQHYHVASSRGRADAQPAGARSAGTAGSACSSIQTRCGFEGCCARCKRKQCGARWACGAECRLGG